MRQSPVIFGEHDRSAQFSIIRKLYSFPNGIHLRAQGHKRPLAVPFNVTVSVPVDEDAGWRRFG
jgi:hypothetical protein